MMMMMNDLAASLSLWSSCTSWDFHQRNPPATAEPHRQEPAVDVGVWMPLYHWKFRRLQGWLVLSITYNTSISNTPYLHAGNTKTAIIKCENTKVWKFCENSEVTRKHLQVLQRYKRHCCVSFCCYIFLSLSKIPVYCSDWYNMRILYFVFCFLYFAFLLFLHVFVILEMLLM